MTARGNTIQEMSSKREFKSSQGRVRILKNNKPREHFLVTRKAYRGDGNVDLTPVIEDYKDALFAKWPLTRYQPMERYWKLRSLVTTFLPSRFSDWFYVLRHN